jgi:3-oxoacyl-(acyl-carrier-protein) reductase
MLPTVNLKGHVALVTGASRGIGRAVAEALAAHGTSVAVNYTNQDEKAQEVVDAIRAAGGKALRHRANVADLDEVREMVRRVEKDLGHIDILVNNAGINRDRSFKNMDATEWGKVLGVNLTGAFNCTRTVIDGMLVRQYGRIVNMSSVVGQAGNFGQANYSATKAGIIGLTKTVALETARKGVTVNAICPGFIATEMVGGIPEDVQAQILARIPLGRFGQAEEIAAAVLFLVADEAAYITGQIIAPNGGLYMS